jgi:hypothetical protein
MNARLGFGLGCGAVAASLAMGVAAPASAIERIHDLGMAAFMAGCWAAEGRGPGSGEVWLAPAGGLMLGVSRTLRAGRPAEFEFMQIRVDGESRLELIAQPSGQKTTAFTLKSHEPRALVFENPAHDFPTRVIYRSPAPDRLEARIEGLRNGQLRGIDFRFDRVACGNEPLAAGAPR